MLVRRALKGDAHARDEVSQRLGCVRRMLASRNKQLGRVLGQVELEDVAQDVVVSIWSKLDTYSGRGDFEAWVYRFCFLEVMAVLRARDRLPKLALDLSGDEYPEEPAAKREIGPLEFEYLYRALEQLSRCDADIIRAKHLEAMTFEEISDCVELNVNTVKTRYYRGLRRLEMLIRRAGPRGESAHGITIE